jgi:hypothetical protein
MQQRSGGSSDPSDASIASAAHDTLAAADRKRLRPRLARKSRRVAAPTFPAEKVEAAGGMAASGFAIRRVSDYAP